LKHLDEVLLKLLLGGKDEERNQKIKEIIKGYARRGKMAVVTEIDIINELKKMNNILNKLEGNLEVIALELGEIKQIIKKEVI
jgi:hypothetical protein